MNNKPDISINRDWLPAGVVRVYGVTNPRLIPINRKGTAALVERRERKNRYSARMLLFQEFGEDSHAIKKT